MAEQIPFAATVSFGAEDFAENPEPRCPVVLVLDVSRSMSGPPIAELNDGLRAFKDELMADELAAKRCEVAIVTFGPVQTVQEFVTAATFQPPVLTAQGDTPMGAALLQAVEVVRVRKATYRANGIGHFRPWIFLITDGAPTDAWQHAAELIREGETGKSFAFFAVGVQGAQMDLLAQLAVRQPLRLQGLKFRELFQWLSASMKSVSHSTPGDDVPLPAPTGWASV
jgi:uncharacterized protein YegL